VGRGSWRCERLSRSRTGSGRRAGWVSASRRASGWAVPGRLREWPMCQKMGDPATSLLLSNGMPCNALKQSPTGSKAAAGHRFSHSTRYFFCIAGPSPPPIDVEGSHTKPPRPEGGPGQGGARGGRGWGWAGAPGVGQDGKEGPPVPSGAGRKGVIVRTVLCPWLTPEPAPPFEHETRERGHSRGSTTFAPSRRLPFQLDK
jgi:hypothetical protein